jgi:hypothetical protein
MPEALGSYFQPAVTEEPTPPDRLMEVPPLAGWQMIVMMAAALVVVTLAGVIALKLVPVDSYLFVVGIGVVCCLTLTMVGLIFRRAR